MIAPAIAAPISAWRASNSSSSATTDSCGKFTSLVITDCPVVTMLLSARPNILRCRRECWKMANYVLVYTGGGGMENDETARQQIMEAWGKWFGSLGDKLVDGGNPFGPSNSIASNGSVSSNGGAGLT